MSLLAAVIHLQAPQTTIPRWLGRAAQAWLLQEIRRVDPPLASWLHTGQTSESQQSRRPYTVSVPRDNNQTNECWLRITSVSPDLSGVLREKILPTLVTIPLAGLTFQVASVQVDSHDWAGQSDFETLARVAFSMPDIDKITLGFEFATPTAFHSAGLTVPLPIPALVYGSLIHAWDSFSPVPLPVTLGDFVTQSMGIARHRIATQMVQLGEQQRQIGFMGTARYMFVPQEKSGILQDEYRQRLQTISLLTQFAFYVGIGVRTTVGLGQVRPL
ncbi:MAG: CRISPR system precrRNA processing endoribonuclease RAMP protein Cas6 [Chloroflexota bacterium]